MLSRDNGMINDVHGIDSHYHRASEFNGLFICVMTNSSENRRTVNGGQLYQVNVKTMFI